MSDREEQLKRDIRDLQTRLADALRPRDRIVKVPVEVIKYVDRIVKVPVEVIKYVDKVKKVDRVKEVKVPVEVIKNNTIYRQCKIQAARIAELEAIISIMERECQARAKPFA